MTVAEPLDPFSEIVDERRRWMPDWYSWLQSLVSGVNSTDISTLTGYERDIWTPTLTFATPGDLSVVYSTRNGLYIKIGTLVYVAFSMVTSTFTHGTASGDLNITGLPFPVATSPAANQRSGQLVFQGITKANYTQFVLSFEDSPGSFAIVEASGSGQNVSIVGAGDMPSGGSVGLRGGGVYATDV